MSESQALLSTVLTEWNDKQHIKTKKAFCEISRIQLGKLVPNGYCNRDRRSPCSCPARTRRLEGDECMIPSLRVRGTAQRLCGHRHCDRNQADARPSHGHPGRRRDSRYGGPAFGLSLGSPGWARAPSPGQARAKSETIRDAAAAAGRPGPSTPWPGPAAAE
jgi:hypothetical protein